MRLIITIYLTLWSCAFAQIYADFQVSSGGSSLGAFRIQLEHEKARRTCANFIGLATGRKPWVDISTGAVRTNTPFYNDLTFHRLIHNFMIQGGSPNGQGTDNPGFTILDEFHPDLLHSSDYVLSMAKSRYPNTGGSQFFITLTATPHLDLKHSVFGRVISGTDIIDRFKNATNHPTNSSDRPVTPIIIDSVTISGPSYNNFDIEQPSLRLPKIFETETTPVFNPSTKELSIRFNLSAKANHHILASTNLTNWVVPRHLLSTTSIPNQSFSYAVGDLPAAFVRLTTSNYSDIPLAPATVTKIRIQQTPIHTLDLTLNGSNGTWQSSDGTSGNLSDVTYSSDAPQNRFLTLEQLEADRFSLANLRATFSSPAGPEAWLSLNTYLSFHTETSGWLEETSGTARRKPFILLTE